MPKAHATIYVGIDVSKDKLAVATAVGDRRDEVLSLGTFENTPASVDKLLKKLSGRGDISVCYEAGPTGYGLYRQVRAFSYPQAKIDDLLPWNLKPSSRTHVGRNRRLRCSGVGRGVLILRLSPRLSENGLNDGRQISRVTHRDWSRPATAKGPWA